MAPLRSIGNLLPDMVEISFCTLAQYWWMSVFVTRQVGLINLLPAFIFLVIWYGFVKVEFERKQFWWRFLPGFLLTLRLPLTVSRFLEPMSWLLYLVVIGLVLQRVISHCKFRKQLALSVATTVIILCNSVGHIWLDSPYTYGFRVINNLPSNYSGVEDNQTWECPYERAAIAVSCDMRHYLKTQKIFTAPELEDASNAVFLHRFFYGYLSSLIGFEGTRWVASFTLNLLFWGLACVAMFRLCILMHLSRRIAAIAMLCCASSEGFVYFVGQPSPHMTAYAYAAITLWATVEMIFCTDIRKKALLAAIIISGPLSYEIYPVTAASCLLLFLYHKRVEAVLLLLTQGLLLFLWKRIVLPVFLGTTGDIESPGSGSFNIQYSLQSWCAAFTDWCPVPEKIDDPNPFDLAFRGIQSYTYGGLILGAIASLLLITYLVVHRKWRDQNKRLLLTFCSCLCVLTLLATVFVSPQAFFWNPTVAIQPRHAFFAYPAHTIAIACIAGWMLKKWQSYFPAVATFLVANISLTGLVSLELFFDYGLVGIYWK
jgi:hypothetical protein